MRKTSRAFTLIELLVVVAIIVVLISVLMPSLNNARNQAKAVKCMSNLKQMGGAIFMYSQEYNGSIPIALETKGNATPQRYDDPTTSYLDESSPLCWQTNPWMFRLFPYLNVQAPRTNDGNQWRRVLFTGVFNCPSKPDYDMVAATSDIQRLSYSMNCYNPSDSGNDPYKKLNYLDMNMLVISDDHTGYPRLRSYNYLYDQGWLPTNHGTSHNMLFPGGDVQRVKYRGVDWYLKLVNN